MGNQSSSVVQLLLRTDRSLLNQKPSQSESSIFKFKASKTIIVGSIEQLDILKKIFYFRLENRQYLAHLYGFEVEETNGRLLFQKIGCSSSFLSIKITLYSEKIINTFSDLYYIPVQEGLKLLAHCLKGFTLLYEYFGYFYPESRLIFKQDNSWKVWISENIFQNEIEMQDKGSHNQKLKRKFLQKVVHLFDSLRDKEHPYFSYSAFVYGEALKNHSFPKLQLSQILEKLDQNTLIKQPMKLYRYPLRKVSLEFKQTVQKVKNHNVTFSMSKTNKNSMHNRSIIQRYEFKKIQEKSKLNINSNIQLKKERKRISNYLSQDKSIPRQKINFGLNVSSQFVRNTDFNKKSGFKQNDCNNHFKEVSSISTPSNLTAQTKDISFPRMCESSKQNVNNFGRELCKNEKPLTVDLSISNNYCQKKQRLSPIKITQNSELNSESEEIKIQNEYLGQAFNKVGLQVRQNQQNKDLRPLQIFPKSPTNKTPSIANIARNNRKQTMKCLEDQSVVYPRVGPKRLLTGGDSVEAGRSKIKFCWSQEFDSDLFSMESKKENTMLSYLQIKYDATLRKQKQNHLQKEQNSVASFEKKMKKVKISDKEELNQYSCEKESIRQDNQIYEDSQTSKAVSIAKLAIFKSQGGLKSLLGTKLSTLQSIKQIDFDYPLDEDILNDLNKLSKKRRFAKSSKLTK